MPSGTTLSHRSILFFVILFYGLSPRLKSQFTSLITGGKIDRAIHDLECQDMLPPWLKDEICFDPLYGIYPEIRLAIATAIRDLMIRIDGTHFDYHLDQLEEDAIHRLKLRLNLTDEYIAAIIRKLNERLLPPTAAN